MDKSFYNRCLILGAVVLGSVMLTGCREGDPLDSTWTKEALTIDGKGAEWRGKLAYLEGNIDVGFVNDSSFLYVNISSPDRRIQGKILREGLIVWFQPQGVKKPKLFGIKFPIGVQTRPGMMNSETEDSFIASVNSAMQIYEKRNQDGKTVSIVAASSIGLEANLGFEKDRLTYELKVPLHEAAGTPFAAIAGPEGMISVTMETPENLTERRQQQVETQDNFSSSNLNRSRNSDIGPSANGLQGSGRPRSEILSMKFLVKIAQSAVAVPSNVNP